MRELPFQAYMEQESVLAALRFEAGQLIREMANLSEDQWRLPTRCTPWKVNDLLAHVRMVLAWLPGVLIAPEPAVHAEVSAAEYYRADDRFSPDTNTTRIAIARDLAASKLSGAALAADFAATWQLAEQLCRAEPDDRVVLTRHGDLMLLSEFLLTRVVEVAVHGLDLADALGREPWLTVQAGNLVQGFLLGLTSTDALRELGWTQLRFLRKATGREPITGQEAAEIDRLGIRWLTVG